MTKLLQYSESGRASEIQGEFIYVNSSISSQVLEEFRVEGKGKVFAAEFVYGLTTDTVCLCPVACQPWPCWLVIQYC